MASFFTRVARAFTVEVMARDIASSIAGVGCIFLALVLTGTYNAVMTFMSIHEVQLLYAAAAYTLLFSPVRFLLKFLVKRMIGGFWCAARRADEGA